MAGVFLPYTHCLQLLAPPLLENARIARTSPTAASNGTTASNGARNRDPAAKEIPELIVRAMQTVNAATSQRHSIR